jgi:hypothetical protein
MAAARDEMAQSNNLVIPRYRAHRDRRWAGVSWWWSSIFVASLIFLTTTLIVQPGGGDAPDMPSAKSITFTVTDSVTGAPVGGASVSVGGQALLSDASGVVKVPVASVEQDVVVSRDGYESVYGRASTASADHQTVPLAPQPTATPTPAPPAAGAAFAGVVQGENGEPVPDAVVRIGTSWVETAKDGSFSIPYDGRSTDAVVSASGYADKDVRIVPNATIQLERFIVKGIYLRGQLADDPQVIQNLIDLINATELNAVVIDTKDGVIFYDSQIAFYREAGAVVPTYDAAALVKRFHDNGIYVIARQVAFKDPLVAEAHPDLSIKDEKTGKPWTGWAGEPWVNALMPELYQPNVDLAVESANLGFDEIQYDYIRFPDGDLTGADFGPDYNDVDKRIDALTTQLTMTREALRPLGKKLSADIFGWMLLVNDDQGIGQQFEDIAAVVDYVSPMVYPSHFPIGSLAIDGAPNDDPYDTIDISIGLGQSRIPDEQLKMRPWLQDFTLPGMNKYGPQQIRDEIDAAEANNVSGWLVWNIDANYVGGAYKREGETEWYPPAEDDTPVDVDNSNSSG